MRPQRKLQLSRRAMGNRKLFVLVCVGIIFFIIILLGAFISTPSGESGRHAPVKLNAPFPRNEPAPRQTPVPSPDSDTAKKPSSTVPDDFGTEDPTKLAVFPTKQELHRAGIALNFDEPPLLVHPADSTRVFLTDSEIVTASADQRLFMRFPRIDFRDRTTPVSGEEGGPSFAKWEGLTMPNDHLQIPQWVSPAERTVLQDASIFVSLAAYRDPECADTLRSLFESARNPHRIYVGVSEERTGADTDCLRIIDDGPSDEEVIKLMWGPQGADTRVNKHQLFRKYGMLWPDIMARPAASAAIPIVTTEEAVEEQRNGTLNPDTPPTSILLLPSYKNEVMSCVGGRHERARDAFILQITANASHTQFPQLRRGKGGVQQSPSPALAGCRVTRRLSSPKKALGPTFGRYITSLFYMNQDYFMVIDSHSRFSVEWDNKMIRRIFQNPTRGILSHYPNGYTPAKPYEEFTKRDVMVMCRGQVLANAMPKLGAMWMSTRPYNVLQAFAAAGYMFGDAQYALDVPFDPFLPYLFDGEEILYSARLWTSGWDIYGPGEPNIFHHYGRPNTPKFSENVRAAQNAMREQSERRALYLLQRSQPWVQVLEDAEKAYNMTRAQSDDASIAPYTPPPYVPGDQRPVVTEKEALSNPWLSVLRGYYGAGNLRTLPAFWRYCQMDDEKVVKRDNEHRWMGGDALCMEAVKARR